MDKIKSKAYRMFQATKLSDEMISVEAKIDKASNLLLHLAMMLGNALNMQEHHDAVLPKLGNLAVVHSSKDVFLPTTNTPALTDVFKLNFDAKDAAGRPTTPEAVLKLSVLSSESSSTITAAAGVLKSAYTIVGMAGVGKTVALRGLAYDKDVQTRFPDGVLYMTLGQGATLETVLDELLNILVVTGAATLVETVKAATTLRRAVDATVPWFQGRVCLLIVDDMWPTKACRTGFLSDLKQLLRESPASRMAISTRSTTIAEYAGAVVTFGARDPLGNVSLNIFMAYVTRGAPGETFGNRSAGLRNSVQKILEICAGLPIALAVTGSAVRRLSTAFADFDTACDDYARRLEKKRSILGDERTMEGMSLNASILLSLEFLQDDFVTRELNTDHSISDLYTSLCVLQHQARVPLSVLGRLWQLDEDTVMYVVGLFSELSLATLRPACEFSREAGIVLHDLLLDFCQQQAEERNKTCFWHAQLVDGYVAAPNEQRAKEPNAFSTDTLVSFEPRPWWSLAATEDGYIHGNLSRHLTCACLDIELAALLLDVRWTQLRGRIGGILALKSDFELLEKCFLRIENSGERESMVEELRQSFKDIFKTVQLLWARVVSEQRAFQFSVCGRLARARKSNVIIDTYLKSVEKYAPKPCLVPVSSFFPELNSALITEIPVGGRCTCVSSSPCGRYIAAGAGADILVASISSGEILQRLRGHSEDVYCVAFAAGWEKVVSGSGDGKVMIWEWETSESAERVLEGHLDSVLSIAVTSDTRRGFSCALDGTMRTWDMSTGAETEELSQGRAVDCVARGENGMVALGLRDGTLRILDFETKDLLFEDIEAHEGDIDGFERSIECVSFSSNGSYVGTGSRDRTIRVWDIRTWTRVGDSFEGHGDWVTSVAFSPDGKKMASGSMDRTIRLWDVCSGACIGISSKITTAPFTGDGGKIISASRDGIVRIWDARLQSEANEDLHAYSDWVVEVAISEDGTRVVSASDNGTLRLWDAQTGEEIGPPLEGHSDGVHCVSFSSDGRRVISGSLDKTLRLWDAETRTQIGDPFEGHTHTVRCVSFSADGRRVVSGSLDTTVRIWNPHTTEQIGEPLRGHSLPVGCVSESADGCRIVSRDIDRVTIIWKRENRAIVWKSENVERATQNDISEEEKDSETDAAHSKDTFENEITNDEAEKIIRSCGEHTPRLWPKSFPVYSAELNCDGESAYSILEGKEALIAANLSPCWAYHSDKKVLVAGLRSGAVAISKFIN